MKKLDEIPKKNIFEVPDDYFDRLPMKIQARLEKPAQTQSGSVWNVAFRYALPSLVAVFALVHFPTHVQIHLLPSLQAKYYATTGLTNQRQLHQN